MKAHYDYTLIDSRTGLSDIADICTVHLPDILVDCFTLNDQSIDGAAAVARNLDQRYHYRNIQVLPVPMRIDEAEKDKADVGLDAGEGAVRSCPRAGLGALRRERLLGRGVDPVQAVLRLRGDARRLRGRPPVAALPARRVRAADRRDHRRAGPRGRGDERGDAAARTGPRSSAAGSRRRATSTSATFPRTGCGRTGSRPCSPSGASASCAPAGLGGRAATPGRTRSSGAGGGQPHDRHPVGRLPAVAAGPGRLGRDGGGGPGRHRPAAHPGPGGGDPARAAVLRADGRGPDPARRRPGDRGAAQGARLSAEADRRGRAARRRRAAVPADHPAGLAGPDQERRPSPGATRCSSSCTTS